MCRLLGLVSRHHGVLADQLGDDLHRFAEMSEFHYDGWGLAAWDAADDLVLHKEPGAAHLEPRMTAAAEAVSSDAAIFHLRRASEGMDVVRENTHPFTMGSVAFAHNGYFAPAETIDKTLAELGAPQPAGGTDSERYFRLVTALISEGGSTVDALRRAAEIIRGSAEEVLALNALLLTHEGLFAYSEYDPTESESRRESAGGSFELRFRLGVNSVIVASTGWEVEDATWEVLPQGAVLEVRRHDLVVSVHPSLEGTA